MQWHGLKLCDNPLETACSLPVQLPNKQPFNPALAFTFSVLAESSVNSLTLCSWRKKHLCPVCMSLGKVWPRTANHSACFNCAQLSDSSEIWKQKLLADSESEKNLRHKQRTTPILRSLLLSKRDQSIGWRGEKQGRIELLNKPVLVGLATCGCVMRSRRRRRRLLRTNKLHVWQAS